uniref:Transmembrane and ubiquitin like domain containing 1 n=1 Tax=Loxodonta africana TaxID=9785 RepID=G3UL96_LOXAF
MALIEGVGDEVTILFAVLACLLVLALAWVSTHTAERADPLPQPSGTPTSAQPSKAVVATDSIRGAAPGAEAPSLRHRGPAAQPEPGTGIPGTPPPPDSPQELLVLRLKFLNDSEQWPGHGPRTSSALEKVSWATAGPPCPPGSEPGPSGLEIGIWYCQIQYRPFFPLTATLGLAGFTLLLSLLAFAMYRP